MEKNIISFPHLEKNQQKLSVDLKKMKSVSYLQRKKLFQSQSIDLQWKKSILYICAVHNLPLRM